METITNNSWLAGLVVLCSQIVFIYFRTLNVIYTADKKLWPSIITGNIVGICWLIAIAIGVDALMNYQWQPIVAHLLGGTIGAYYGIKRKS